MRFVVGVSIALSGVVAAGPSSLAAMHTPRAVETVAVQGSPLLLVANMGASTLSIISIDDGRTVATLPTGNGPHEVAASRDGKWAAVSNYGGAGAGGNSLTLVDLERLTVAATIDLGVFHRPHGVAFLPGDSILVATAEANNAVVYVDVRTRQVTGSVATTQRGSHLIAMRGDGTMGYTSNVFDGTVTELDIAKRATGRVIAVAPRSEGIALTPNGEQVWVGSNDRNVVLVIDTKAWKVIDTLASPGMPYRINMTPDNATALVSAPMSNAVLFFDVASRKETLALAMPAGSEPVGGTISRDGAFAFISCQGTNSVAQIDLRTRTVIRSLPVGAGPDGITIAYR